MCGAHGRSFDARLPRSIRGIVWLADGEFVPATIGVEPPAELLRTVRAASGARDVILVPVFAAYHGVALACEGDDLAVVRASLPRWTSDGGEDAAPGEVVEHHVAPSTVAEVLDVARDEGFEGAAVREAVGSGALALLWESAPLPATAARLQEELGVPSLVWSPAEAPDPERAGDFLTVQRENAQRLRALLPR